MVRRENRKKKKRRTFRQLLSTAWRQKWFRQAVYVALMLYGVHAVRFYTVQPDPEVDYLALLNANVADIPEDERAWPALSQWFEAIEEVQELQDQQRTRLLPLDVGGVVTDYMPSLRGIGGMWVMDRTHDFTSLIAEDSYFVEPGIWGPYMAYRHEAYYSFARRYATEIQVLSQIVDSYDHLGYQFAPTDNEQYALFRKQLNDVENVQLLVSLMAPHFWYCRQASRYLSIDAWRAMGERDVETFMHRLRQRIKLASWAASHSPMYSKLNGLSIQRHVLDDINIALIHDANHFTREQLADLSDIVQSITMYSDFSVEIMRWEALDIVQHVFSNDFQGNGHLTYNGMKLLWGGTNDVIHTMLFNHDQGALGRWVYDPILKLVLPLHSLVVPTRPKLERQIDEYYDRLDDLLAYPIWHSKRIHDPFEVSYYWQNSLPGNYFRPEVFYKSLVRPVGPLDNAFRTADAIHQSTLAGVALTRFKRDHQRYPTQLSELVPDYLDHLPIDPVTGEPMLYQLGGYNRFGLPDFMPIIYSLGDDRDDDGGQFYRPTLHGSDDITLSTYARLEFYTHPDYIEDGDIVFWPTIDSFYNPIETDEGDDELTWREEVMQYFE